MFRQGWFCEFPTVRVHLLDTLRFDFPSLSQQPVRGAILISSSLDHIYPLLLGLEHTYEFKTLFKAVQIPSPSSLPHLGSCLPPDVCTTRCLCPRV
jgi:hypothetical protein